LASRLIDAGCHGIDPERTSVAHHDPLESAKDELRQAGKDLETLEGDIRRYVESNALEVVLSVDAAHLRHVFNLRVHKELSAGVSDIARVAVQGMQSALDQMFTVWAQRIIERRPGFPQADQEELQFPITPSADDFYLTKAGLGFGSDEEWAFIQRVQPYHGENALEALQDLSNPGRSFLFDVLIIDGRLVPSPLPFAKLEWNKDALANGAEVVRVTFPAGSPKMNVHLNSPNFGCCFQQPLSTEPFINAVGGKQVRENALYWLKHTFGVIETIRDDFGRQLR
jgi:hypothetical protein